MNIKWSTRFFLIPAIIVFTGLKLSRKHSLKKLEYVSYFDNKVTPADDF
jgi:hypothetical protein